MICLACLVLTILIVGCKNEKEYGVGLRGPSGGYIFYDCDADNESGNPDGLISTECGWRFLEAAPADLRLVDGIPTVDSSKEGYSEATAKYVFGIYIVADDGAFVNGTQVYNAADCTRTGIGEGKHNTRQLYYCMAEKASYVYDERTTGNYAARLCELLTHKSKGVLYDDWFLPSKEELNQIFLNLYQHGLGMLEGMYWSSSELDIEYYSNNPPEWSRVWIQYFYDGRNWYDDGDQLIEIRSEEYKIRPVRAFI